MWIARAQCIIYTHTNLGSAYLKMFTFNAYNQKSVITNLDISKIGLDLVCFAFFLKLLVATYCWDVQLTEWIFKE